MQSPTITIRIPVDELRVLIAAIKVWRMDRKGKISACMSAFVRQAIREKIAHVRHSKAKRKKEADLPPDPYTDMPPPWDDLLQAAIVPDIVINAKENL